MAPAVVPEEAEGEDASLAVSVVVLRSLGKSSRMARAGGWLVSEENRRSHVWETIAWEIIDRSKKGFVVAVRQGRLCGHHLKRDLGEIQEEAGQRLASRSLAG